MTVRTPACLGLILRKNERTRLFIERTTRNLLEAFPEAAGNLNEDEHLIAFTVAMNGDDLDDAIGELQEQQAVYGVDFVATSSSNGVMGQLPVWLSEKSERMPAEYMQLVKFYSFIATDQGLESGA